MFRIIPFTLVSMLFAQTYNWPISPFTSEHDVNATYGELRNEGSFGQARYYDTFFCMPSLKRLNYTVDIVIGWILVQLISSGV